jgi:hypothetical protein
VEADSEVTAHGSITYFIEFLRVSRLWEDEEAPLGYNPHKPGRPSHVSQAFLCSAAKLVLNVDVQAGNQTASEHAQPVLWGWQGAGRASRAASACKAGAGTGA